MSLADDLIAKARKKILDFQATAGAQDAIRKQYLELWALKPAGLGVFSRGSIDLQDFAEVIETHRAELRPWILVYGAALGALGPWESTLSVWCRANVSAPATIPPVVEETMASLFTGYARLIAA